MDDPSKLLPTQEYYDSIVLENINDFEMDVPAALKDAREQLILQNRITTKLVDDPDAYSDGTVNHGLTEAFNKFVDGDMESLQRMVDECLAKENIAWLISTPEKYEKLLELVIPSTPATSIPALKVIRYLFKCDQSLLHYFNSAEKFMAFLSNCETSLEANQLLLVLIAATAKCEPNKDLLDKQGISKVLGQTLEKFGVEVTSNVFSVMQKLTTDDDMSNDVSGCHTRAKDLAHNVKVICSLLLVEISNQKPEFIRSVLKALGFVMVRADICQAFVTEHKGLDILSQALTLHQTDDVLVKTSFVLLKKLTGDDLVKREVHRRDLIPLICQLYERHSVSNAVCEAANSLISMLALRQSPICVQLITCRAHLSIVASMKTHRESEGVQKWACHAVRNIVARNPDLRSAFLDEGVEIELRGVETNFPDLAQDAKAALRDLQLDVKLQEEWTGIKNPINKTTDEGQASGV